MAEYSKISEGRFTGTAATPHFIPLAFVPRMIEIWNKTEYGSSNATPQVQYALGFATDDSGTAFTTSNTTGAATLENAIISSGGFTFFEGGSPPFGPVVTGASVARANPTEVNINSHGFVTGDTVWIFGTTGMLQIAGLPYLVTRVNDNQFTINIDSTGFAADATAVSAKLWYPVAIPNQFEPFYTAISAITRGVTTLITTPVAHAFVVGQEVYFVIPDEWGIVELDGLKGFVTAITATSITVDINSSAFTAFSFPTSAEAAAGVNFPQVIPIGDENFGFSGPITSTTRLTIPGAFGMTTSPGVLVGASLITNVSGGGAEIAWRAEFPDQFVDET